MASYDEAAVVFKQFDYDASGYVDEVEMFSALSDFGLSGDEIDTIFYQLDVDGDSRVSKDEFCKGWYEAFPTPPTPAPTPDPGYARRKELVFAIVVGMEEDQDGELAEEELLAWAQLFDKGYKEYEELPEELKACCGCTKYEAVEALLRYLPDEAEDDLERMLKTMRENGMTVQMLAAKHVGEAGANFEPLGLPIAERRRECIVQIVSGMDGDGNGNLTEDEVLRYWRVFFATPGFDEVDGEIKAAVGLCKDDAIEHFLMIANKRELSLDDLERDVNEMSADGIQIMTRRAYVEQIIGGMDGDGSGNLTQDEVLKYYQVFDPECVDFSDVDPGLKQAAGMNQQDAIEIFLTLANKRQLRLQDLEADVDNMKKSGFVIPEWHEDPMFDKIEEKSAEEVAIDAQKKQLVAVIVGAMDADKDGKIGQDEVLRYYQVFHSKCKSWEEVDPDIAMAAGRSRRDAINVFMETAQGKSVEDLELEVAEMKAEGMKVGFSGASGQDEADDEGEQNTPPAHSVPDEVADVMALARKLELVAQIVGSMDGDGDGNITQEEVMRYYKVFMSCTKWEDVDPELAVAAGKGKGEVIGIFMMLAAEKDFEDLQADMEELTSEGFELKKTKVRALIEEIITALDGDGSGKISQAEVLRFWKAFDTTCEAAEDIPSDIAKMVGLTKEDAATSIQASTT